MSDALEDIKKELKGGTLLFGARETMHALRQGTLKRVFVAANAPQGIRTDLEHAGSLTQTPIEQLGIPSSELGVVCKKQFSIAILGEKK